MPFSRENKVMEEFQALFWDLRLLRPFFDVPHRSQEKQAKAKATNHPDHFSVSHWTQVVGSQGMSIGQNWALSTPLKTYLRLSSG